MSNYKKNLSSAAPINCASVAWASLHHLHMHRVIERSRSLIDPDLRDPPGHLRTWSRLYKSPVSLLGKVIFVQLVQVRSKRLITNVGLGDKPV